MPATQPLLQVTSFHTVCPFCFPNLSILLTLIFYAKSLLVLFLAPLKCLKLTFSCKHNLHDGLHHFKKSFLEKIVLNLNINSEM